MRSDFGAFCQLTGLTRRLLVVAPHPDDETIGCGGLIASATAAGMEVIVVVVTDGGASHQQSPTWPRDRLARQRKVEVKRAIAILGVIGRPHFLDLPDAHTTSLCESTRREACNRLAQIIDDVRPDVILTTWRREPHCDHRFSYTLTAEAMALANSDAICVEYMVWTHLLGTDHDAPLPGETRGFQLAIDAVRAKKRRALAAHRSQLGRLIGDDPSGFVLTPVQFQAMTTGDEHFELPR